MTTIDELKAAAQEARSAQLGSSAQMMQALARLRALANPETVLALIDRLRAAEAVVGALQQSEWRKADRFKEALAAYDALGGRE